MRPADIEDLVSVGAPTLHPSGDRVVAGRGHPDLGSDRAVSQLWEHPLPDGPPRMLTRGPGDRAARYSPDGRMLGFLRSGDGPPQLHVVDSRGGEPIALTDRTLGVESFVWSPDSRVIVVVSREPERGRYGSVEGLEPDAEPARRITTRTWSENGTGWSGDRRRQLFAVDVPALDAEPDYPAAPSADGPAAKRVGVPVAHVLTKGDTDHHAPFFSPDGSEVWFIAARHSTRDLDLRDDLHRVRLDDPGEPEGMTSDGPARSYSAAGFDRDGRLWAVAQELGERGLDFVGTDSALYVDDGSGLRALTDASSRHVEAASAPLRFDDRGRALVILADRGREVLVAVGADGDVERLTDDATVVTAADTAGGRVVASIATPASAGELLLVGSGVLTDLGSRIRSTGLVTPGEEEHPSRDGYPVHGWVAIPDGQGPHPVLLMIHGGPFAQYGVQLFDETQVWADAGYAVVYANPRGSLGYGQDHGRAIRERMGTVDLDDVLAFLDGAVAAHPQLDGARVGVLGGSYGGYLTAWTIAHDHRFAAAVVERGFLDPEVFIGTSDIGAFFADGYLGSDPAHRLSQSPQAVVDRVRTPTLVIHSEDDLRCPLSQATRYYTALKRNGVETELLVFPGEDHELSRSGRPRHRVQRFEAILDWLNRHLPVAGTDAGEGA